MSPADVQTLVLPKSGWVLQWRADGFWRDLSGLQYRDELDGRHRAAEDEWVRWSGTYHQQARGGRGPEPAWWVTYGELTGDAAPSVVLADGRRPAVCVLGKVWACEWWSGPQEFAISPSVT
ncbi:hypothetical protein [Paractinoplanes atraurantiacus]|uniref:Uncharacterized protein n=1 Tax=Paractinoplanes atraurantiacus TaxID=1036182 RepID=A0A285IA40_9ACTN|nr:hypothetical protein [Actinoplanes atraurantiacus]SNY43936.1 hypothetical protein SAMN05421748_10710 [Actinoplanes atraurantiacus]